MFNSTKIISAPYSIALPDHRLWSVMLKPDNWPPELHYDLC